MVLRIIELQSCLLLLRHNVLSVVYILAKQAGYGVYVLIFDIVGLHLKPKFFKLIIQFTLVILTFD